MQSPLFVIGNPRSGTTLLRLMLTCHPAVIIPPECGFVIWLKRKYFNWALADSGNTAIVNELVNDLFECRKFETWELDQASVSRAIKLEKTLHLR